MTPRFELPAITDLNQSQGGKTRTGYVCHFCHEAGHKAMYCQKMTPEERAEQARIENESFFKKFTMQTKIGKMYMQQILTQAVGQESSSPSNSNITMNETLADKSRLFRQHPKPLEEVTCFKCGVKGHYANRCPKGHLAFLSKAQLSHQDEK